MSYESSLHISNYGYVMPSESAESMIYQNLPEVITAIEPIDDHEAMKVVDYIVEISFEAGWFFDDLDDESSQAIVDEATVAHDYEPEDSSVNTYFNLMAQRAATIGSQAYCKTYDKLMNGK